MDTIDQAQAAEQRARDKAIAEARAQTAANGTTDCVDCGEEIPAARKQAYPSATRCVACQQKEEAKR